MAVSIFTGDDIAIKVNLKNNGAKFPIPSGSVVKAAIFDYRDYSVILGPTTVSEASADSDWDNGVAVVTFSAAETEVLEAKTGLGIELEVNAGALGRKTWQGKGVEVVPGAIANA